MVELHVARGRRVEGPGIGADLDPKRIATLGGRARAARHHRAVAELLLTVVIGEEAVGAGGAEEVRRIEPAWRQPPVVPAEGRLVLVERVKPNGVGNHELPAESLRAEGARAVAHGQQRHAFTEELGVVSAALAECHRKAGEEITKLAISGTHATHVRRGHRVPILHGVAQGALHVVHTLMYRANFAELAWWRTKHEPVFEHEGVHAAADNAGLLAHDSPAKVRFAVGAALVGHRAPVGTGVAQRTDRDVRLSKQTEAGARERHLLH